MLPLAVISPNTSSEPVCVNEPLKSTLPLKSALPSTLKLFTIVNSFVCALIFNPRLSPAPSCSSTSPLADVNGSNEFSKFIIPKKDWLINKLLKLLIVIVYVNCHSLKASSIWLLSYRSGVVPQTFGDVHNSQASQVPKSSNGICRTGKLKKL